MDTKKKLSISQKYNYVVLDNEIIFMPILDNDISRAYVFSDDVGKNIAEGVINHLCIYDIIDFICVKYSVDRNEAAKDVSDIVEYLLRVGVIIYDQNKN